jgi:CheY-like chemotaxis protein
MAGKRALVVDDSKSARVVLSRMLEKYGIAVDTAASAEDALEYLKSQRPDVVFMDHMMPGMDGLQAVKLIKANPDTATLPIMMYTSQEGELYVGQARALGAVGVLPKTVRPVDVTKVLYQLRLLPDRRDGARSPLQPVDATGQEEPLPAAATEVAPATDARWRSMLDAALREQSLELRRFVVSSLESQAHRLLAELRAREPEAPPLPLPPPETAPVRPWGWMLATAAALLACAALAFLQWQTLTTAREVEAARARLETESRSLRATLEQIRNSPAAAGVAAAATRQAPSEPEVITVPFGEPALAPVRLEAVRVLVTQLERVGFKGTVRVETFTGDFCLAGAADGDYMLADPTTPATRCVSAASRAEDSPSAERQPLAFVNLAASVRRRTDGAIDLVLAEGPESRRAAAYPPPAQSTAAQWNAVAAANNRLEITVIPR